MNVDNEKNEEKPHNDDEKEDCILFMDSLPRNFMSHSGLAAIASLIEEDQQTRRKAEIESSCDGSIKREVAAKKSNIIIKKGNQNRPVVAKAGRMKKGNNAKHKIISKQQKQNLKQEKSESGNDDNEQKMDLMENDATALTQASTSTGEVQLFMSMWKL